MINTAVVNFILPSWFDGEEKTKNKGKQHRLIILSSINDIKVISFGVGDIFLIADFNFYDTLMREIMVNTFFQQSYIYY